MKTEIHNTLGKLRHAQLWAITEAGWSLIEQRMSQLSALQQAQLEPAAPLAARVSNGAKPNIKIVHIPLVGVIINRASALERILFGAVSPQQFAAVVREQANDASVSHIVIEIDSPGGTVAGTEAAADAVAYARRKKPVIAVATSMAASAAYWIASQASRIVVGNNSEVGSIGVLAVHLDYSQMLEQNGIRATVLRSAPKKALGQPYEALDEEARADWSNMLQQYHERFAEAVRRGRKRSESWIEKVATGATWIGNDAVERGLADEVGSLESVIADIAQGRYNNAARAELESLDVVVSDERNADAQQKSSNGGNSVTPEQIAELESNARAQETVRIAAALGLTTDELSEAQIGAVRQRLEAGQRYRSSLEQRLRVALIAMAGPEAEHSPVLRLASRASMDELEQLVQAAEADKNAMIPVGRQSKPEPAPSAAKRRVMYP